MAHMALVTTHNVLATDRPDLPRAPDTAWTTNFLREIAAIDDAVEHLVGEPHAPTTKEQPMQPQSAEHHEIARIAAHEWAQTHAPLAGSPEAFGEEVARVYRAALSLVAAGTSE